MDTAKIAAYVGSLIAIGIGAALLWFPPAQLAGQGATIGSAFSFITIGLTGFGLTAAVPAVHAAALAEGERRGVARSMGASRGVPPPPRHG